jgi:hypothetical protein
MAKQMSVSDVVFYTVFVRTLKGGVQTTRKGVAEKIASTAYPQREGESDDRYSMRIRPVVGTMYTKLNSVIKALEGGECDILGTPQQQGVILDMVNKVLPDNRGRKARQMGESEKTLLMGELADLFGED